MEIYQLSVVPIVSPLSSTSFIKLLVLLIGRIRIRELIEAPEGEIVAAMREETKIYKREIAAAILQ